ncbi:MAG: diguanylate cyclase [Chloroflexota bacterium]
MQGSVPAGQNESPRILVVEDSPDIAELLAMALAGCQWRVHICPTGEEALATAARTDPDLILLDVTLPDTDGFAVCRALRARAETQHTPIIFLTARTQQQEKVRALDMGANDYVTKPFQMDELLARIRVGLRTKSMQDSLRQTNAELLELSNTDPLTDLYNRRYFDDRVHQELARARRYGHPLSCCLVDLDHFKNVNDTHGHLDGDHVLRETAHLLRESTREEDVVARYGGEEFVLLLMQQDGLSAVKVAEKIRRSIAEHSFHLPSGAHLHLTVSVGVSSYEGGAMEPAELIHAADMALYGVKQGGRNQVRLAS